MKGLTLTQPWASLVALGEKTYETRSWKTDYRGDLAIHSAIRFPSSAKSLCRVEPFRSSLRNVDDLPLGFILSVVTLEAIIPTFSTRDYIDEKNLIFGDFGDGRWAWRLTNLRRLSEPVKSHGALGLWDVSYDAQMLINKQLKGSK